MMSELLEQIHQLHKNAEIKISVHGYEELANDNILAREVMDGFESSKVVEEYPDYHKGPCILMLQHDTNGQPIHVLWGIPFGQTSPAVLITAYRPDPKRWHEDFVRRK